MNDQRKVQVVELDRRVVERQVFTGDTPPPVNVPPVQMAGRVVKIHVEPA